MTYSRQSLIRTLSAGLLALASAALANAQCYQFAGSGVTLRVDITSFNLTNPPVSVAGGRFASYLFSSNNTLVVGSATQTSFSVFDGAITIEYLPSFGNSPAVTEFQIVVPDATTVVTPRSGSHSWEAQLFGAGDLLPRGLVFTLPGISAWFVPPPSDLSNYIEVDSGNTKTKYPITSIASCPSTTNAVDVYKTLGIACDYPGCVTCGEPINLGTGNVFDRVIDYQTAGPNKLDFTRYYNSLAAPGTYAVRLGSNWRSTYDRYLHLSTKSVIAERADGRQISFALSTSGAWTPESDVDYTLSNSGSTWILTDSHDTVETYTATGTDEAVLQSIRSRNGYTQTLQYLSGNLLNAVSDSFHRQLSFNYAGGKLDSVATPDGLILNYGYTGNNLTSVAYNTAPATSRKYLYENTALPSALTGIIDENGNRYVTWTYDSKGRGLTSQFAGGVDRTTVAYNDNDGSRTVTNALGAQTVYKFTALQNTPKVTGIDRLATANTPAATSTFVYDNSGYLASTTDWNGNRTSYSNDSRGRHVTIVEASGTPQARGTSITYHPSLHLPVQVSTAGLMVTLNYDSAGQLLTRTLTDSTTTTVPYSTNRQTRTWTYTWSNYNLASITTPLSNATKLSWDAGGALAAITNALGQTFSVPSHTTGGLPLTTIDWNGVETDLIYDVRSRLSGVTVNTAAGPLTTRYTYDAAGNKIGIAQPDGSAYSQSYDAAHRLTGIQDLLGQSATVSFDALNDAVSVATLDSTGNPQKGRSGIYDALGRLRQSKNGVGQVTNFAYDPNGNRVTITDALNHALQLAYDPLNRVAKVTDPANGATTQTLDAHNRTLSLTDANGATTSFVYDGFGEVIQATSPDAGTTVYRWDAGGNLTQRVDANGATVNLSYDALDRLISKMYPANPAENVSYAYDQGGGFGVGRLTSVTDAAGTLTRSYDERGNIVAESRVNGGVTMNTAYTYDALNRILSVTYPSGWTALYTRDAMGRVTGITMQSADGATSLPVLYNATYQTFGPPNALAFGNGVTETRSFDKEYRVTALSDKGDSAVQSLSYAYDSGNNVLAIADGVNPGNNQAFGYDALDRLTSAGGAYGQNGYSYDSVGNRLGLTGPSAAGYTFAARSNRLTAMASNGVMQDVGYDKAGNMTTFNPPVGNITGMQYNQAGRLAAVMTAAGPAAQYTYDAFGQRLAKLGAVTGTTLYQYGPKRQLMEETGDQGSPLADYIYADGVPVAVLAPATGQLYWLHNDRMGTPQVATAADQSVVWSASYGPFGEMASAPSLIVQNLRLPGQEYDADTGLYHNGFRDYVPALGRYVESDPVGLRGGVNTYAYGNGNPLSSADRFGLASTGVPDPDAVAQLQFNRWVASTQAGLNSKDPAVQQAAINSCLGTGLSRLVCHPLGPDYVDPVLDPLANLAIATGPALLASAALLETAVFAAGGEILVDAAGLTGASDASAAGAMISFTFKPSQETSMGLGLEGAANLLTELSPGNPFVAAAAAGAYIIEEAGWSRDVKELMKSLFTDETPPSTGCSKPK